jgi:hypothetical protein
MHVFSANGAAFTASLGKRPRIDGTKTATALKARLNFLQKFLKNIRAIEAPLALTKHDMITSTRDECVHPIIRKLRREFLRESRVSRSETPIVDNATGTFARH